MGNTRRPQWISELVGLGTREAGRHSNFPCVKVRDNYPTERRGVPKQLPKKQASLDERGLEKLINMAKKDPELARYAADRLEEDPRSVIEECFRLSDRQREAIRNTSDEQLRGRTAELVHALRSDRLKDIKFTYRPGGPDSVRE